MKNMNDRADLLFFIFLNHILWKDYIYLHFLNTIQKSLRYTVINISFLDENKYSKL